MRVTNKRLGVESLEDRLALACSVSVADGHLMIKGDNAPDTVQIQDFGNGYIHGFATGFGPFSFANIRKITINTEGGSDTVSYDLMGNLIANQKQYVVVGLGSNYDRTSDKFTAFLNGYDIQAGARLDLLADGGGGRDTLEINAWNTDVAGGGVLKTTISGGWDADTILQRYAGENDGAVAFRSFGGKGADYIFQHMHAKLGSTGQLAGWVKGEEDNDHLTLHLFTPAGNPPVFAVLDGGLGTDAWSATMNVTKINCP